MRAAVVQQVGTPPVYGAFEDPVAGDGEVVVDVAFAALSQLVRGIAAGRHYSATHGAAFVPGVDGIGRLAGGELVSFAFTRAPFGAMAERSVVDRRFVRALAPGLDPAVAAAAANPAMSSWCGLTMRAKLVAGERVLINGATGTSGRLAVAIARELGAGRVVATGRDAAVLGDLREIGADATISLAGTDAEVESAFKQEIADHGVDVVLDYLWGRPAGLLLHALVGGRSAEREPRVRFVQIGSSAGTTLDLDAKILRSSGLELLGSGLGSNSLESIVDGTAAFFRAFAGRTLPIETLVVPLAEVASAWNDPRGERARLVFAV